MSPFQATQAQVVVLFFFLFKLFLAVPGLSRSARDLQSSLQHVGSLVAACGLLVAAMWDLVPCPGMEPGPLSWEGRVLATGPPEKSPQVVILNLWGQGLLFKES